MDTSDTLSTQQVLEALRDLDSQVTRDQLHRWQREGVIPRPTQRGLGQGNGSESFYPDHAVQHIRRAAVLLSKHRSLDDAAWQLWLEGFEIHEKHWKPVLQRAESNLARGSRVLERLIRFDERSESPETLADKIAGSRRGPYPLNLTWHLLQMKDRARVIRLLAYVCAGNELGLENHDADEMQNDETSILKFLGLNQSQSDSFFGAKIQVGSQLLRVFKAISSSIVQLQVNEHSSLVLDVDVFAARDYVRDAIVTFSDFHEASNWIFGKSAFGLRLLTSLFRKRRPLLTATAILIWWNLGKMSHFDLMSHSDLVLLKKSANQMVADSRRLQALSTTQAFRTLLSPKSIRHAFSSEKQFPRFLADLRMVRSDG